MSTSLISNTSTSAEFGQQFNEIFEQTIEMFVVPEFVTAGNQHESDVEKIRMAVDRVKISTDRSKGIMEAARKELQNTKTFYEQSKNSSTRSTSGSSAIQHEEIMVKAQTTRIGLLKSNATLEQQLTREQGELERLQGELKDEEVDAVDEVEELNSEVLRVKLYRDFGFTPMEIDGVFSKILVRSRNSQVARTITLDSTNNDYFWANFLWDALGA